MAGKYTRVGSVKGPLVIGGALSKFDSDPSFVYVPMFRVAGPKDEVTQWLSENHPDEAKTAMKGCYSKTTLKTASVRKAFDEEVEAASKERQEMTAFRNEMKQVNLMVLVNLVQMYQKNKRERSSEVTEKRTVKTLKEKVSELVKEKKFLDVSSMTDKGTEAKKVVLKKGSLKRHLSQNKKDPLYHVIYNPSSKASVDGVKNFMDNYGSFTPEQMETVISAVSSGNIININKTRSPTRSPLVSPKRTKKTTKKTAAATEEDNDLDDLLSALPVS